jgi:hypothetical protein
LIYNYVFNILFVMTFIIILTEIISVFNLSIVLLIFFGIYYKFNNSIV